MQEVIIFLIDSEYHPLPFLLRDESFLTQYIVKIVQPHFFGHFLPPHFRSKGLIHNRVPPLLPIVPSFQRFTAHHGNGFSVALKAPGL